MRFIWLLLSILLLGCKASESFIYQDLSFLYSADAPVLKTRVFVREDSLKLFLSFSKTESVKSVADLDSRYFISARTASQYSTGAVVNLDSVPMVRINFWENADNLIFAYYLPENNPDAIFFLKLYDIKKGQTRLLDIGQVYRKNSPGKIFLMKNSWNEPVVNQYFKVADTFSLHTYLAIDTISFAFYRKDFLPAAPPFYLHGSTVETENIIPDSSGVVSLALPLTITQEGLAVFSVNEGVPGCFSFLFKKEKFPLLSTPKELIEPLIYLTSEAEFRNLITAENYKMALDSFWLKIGGRYDYSRNLIKHFYSRVEFANKYFTSYKEGWKTDKGMIFIICGRPDAVNRSGNMEEWHYQHLLNKEFYTFTFEKKPLFLSEDNFELIRTVEHSHIWNPIIEKWRKGIIIKTDKL